MKRSLEQIEDMVLRQVVQGVALGMIHDPVVAFEKCLRAVNDVLEAIDDHEKKSGKRLGAELAPMWDKWDLGELEP